MNRLRSHEYKTGSTSPSLTATHHHFHHPPPCPPPLTPNSSSNSTPTLSALRKDLAYILAKLDVFIHECQGPHNSIHLLDGLIRNASTKSPFLGDMTTIASWALSRRFRIDKIALLEDKMALLTQRRRELTKEVRSDFL